MHRGNLLLLFIYLREHIVYVLVYFYQARVAILAFGYRAAADFTAHIPAHAFGYFQPSLMYIPKNLFLADAGSF